MAQPTSNIRPSSSTPAGSNDVVLVACKLPSGIMLSVPKGVPSEDQTHVKLKGVACYGMPNLGRKFQPPKLTENGSHSLTTVSKKFWDQWVEENPDCVPYKRGFFFAANNRADITAQAVDHEGQKTGMEAIDPKKHGVQPLKTDD